MTVPVWVTTRTAPCLVTVRFVDRVLVAPVFQVMVTVWDSAVSRSKQVRGAGGLTTE